MNFCCLPMILRCVMLGALLCSAQTLVVNVGPAWGLSELLQKPLPSRAEVRNEIERIARDDSIAEPVREQAMALYEEALASIETAEGFEAEVAEFRRLRDDAPALLARIRAQLADGAAGAASSIPETVGLREAEQGLAEAEAELSRAREVLSQIEIEKSRRSQRRLELPALLARTTQSIKRMRDDLAAGRALIVDEVESARRMMMRAHEGALAAEAAAYESELQSYNARRELLIARSDSALQRIVPFERTVEAWQQEVAELRRQAATQATHKVVEARRTVEGVHPVLRSIAEENVRLAELRAGGAEGIDSRITAATRDLTRVRKRLASIAEQFEGVRERAEAVGYTEAIGMLMRKRGSELPSTSLYRGRIRDRQQKITDVQIRLLDLQEQRAKLADPGRRLDEVLDAPDLTPAVAELTGLRESGSELLRVQREYTDQLIKDYDAYFVMLVDLDAADRELLARAGEYRDFIQEHVLWIRSTGVLGPSGVRQAYDALAWLVSPDNWSVALQRLKRTAFDHRLQAAFGLLLIALILVYKPRLNAALRAPKPRARTAPAELMLNVAYDLGITVLIALPWPALVYFSGWAFSPGMGPEAEFTRALSGGLVKLAPVYYGAEFARQLCTRNGCLTKDFHVEADTARSIRWKLGWATGWALPLLAVALVLAAGSTDVRSDSLGRLAFIAALIVMVTLAWRLSQFERRPVPTGGSLAQKARTRGFMDLAPLAFSVALGGLAGLAALALTGYYFSAIVLAGRLYATLCLTLLAVVLYALLSDWLQVLQRALVLARRRRGVPAKTVEDGVPRQDELDDLPALSAQAHQMLRAVFAVVFVAALWPVWSDILPALNVLDNVELWRVSAEAGQVVSGDAATRAAEMTVAISLGDLVVALVIVALAILAGRNLPGFLQMTLLQRLPLDAGMRYAITAVARYVITVIGTVLAFGSIGVGWSQVQWLAAAITVGLGFGLQEIFANFVSGLIILFERPIRVGDTVTLGDITGRVTQIKIRATTITDWDRKELIVPNKEFITGQLVNWSLSDDIVRIIVPVGIAYGSDTALAERLLAEAARECRNVLGDPPPSVIFDAFGASSLDFHLRVFIPSIDKMWSVKHAIHLAIDGKFREAGVQIAFPQRDLHLRSVSKPIPVSVTTVGSGPVDDGPPEGSPA